MDPDDSADIQFPPTGGPMTRIADTLRERATTRHGSPGNPSGSETTTSQTPQSLPIGTRRGAPGSSAPTISRSAAQIVATGLAFREWRNPAQLLPPCMRSCLDARACDGDVGHGWDGYVVSYEWIAEPPAVERAIALELLAEALRPASEEMVIGELGRLRAATVSRDVGQDLNVVFAVYADELLRYPPDAVREVLREWPRSGGKWWPSMHELIERLDRVVRPRRALAAALKRGYTPPETSPDWIPPSADEKAAVAEFLGTHGFAGEASRYERPLKATPLSAADRQRVAAECDVFRLPDVDDPRVQARLREMGEPA
jgi:hypothetical protein